MSPLSLRSRLLRGLTAGTAVASLAAVLAGCGGGSDAATHPDSAADGTVTVGAVSNGAAKETALKVSEVKSISAKLPASVARSGKLVIGVGALPSGSAPLTYVGDRPEDPHRLRARLRPAGGRGARP